MIHGGAVVRAVCRAITSSILISTCASLCNSTSGVRVRWDGLTGPNAVPDCCLCRVPANNGPGWSPPRVATSPDRSTTARCPSTRTSRPRWSIKYGLVVAWNGIDRLLMVRTGSGIRSVPSVECLRLSSRRFRWYDRNECTCGGLISHLTRKWANLLVVVVESSCDGSVHHVPEGGRRAWRRRSP